MNDDRCYHVPTAPGQSMCTCTDARMTLMLMVEMLATEVSSLKNQSLLVPLLCKHIAYLEKRLQTHEPKIIEI